MPTKKKTKAFIEERIRWRARKNKLPTECAFYFEELKDEVIQQYTDLLQSEEVGNPVLLFIFPNLNWIIISTKKIVWGKDDSIHSLAYEKIKKVTTHDFGIKKKREYCDIAVTDADGIKHIIPAQEGQDYFRLRNILGMVVNLCT